MTHVVDPEARALIDTAVAIYSSGRWKAINQVIDNMARDPQQRRKWSWRVHAPLCTAVFSNYLALRRIHEQTADGDISALAWRARNLLELSVWATYCARSDENAARFFGDAGRDGLELLKSFGTWGEKKGQGDKWAAQVEEAKVQLIASAEEKGAGSLDGSYVKVRDAARDCGFLDHFAATYKFLSKFAHPTALVLLGNLDSKEKELRDAVFGQGCVLFVGAFTALETCLVKPVTPALGTEALVNIDDRLLRRNLP